MVVITWAGNNPDDKGDNIKFSLPAG